MVLGVDRILFLFVFVGVGFGFFAGFFDVVFAHVAGVLDGNGLLFAGAFVAGGDVQDAVGIEVEGDFDLRDAARRGGDTIKNKAAERLVVGGKFAFALEDVDFDLGLVVAGGRKGLGLGGRNGGVAVDQGSADAAHGLDTESKGCDVEEQDVFDVALEDATLDGGTDGYDFVGIDALHGIFVEDFFDFGDYGGHTSHATNHNNFVDIFCGELGVFEGFFDRLGEAVDEVRDELLEFGTGQSVFEMFGAFGVGG